MNIWSLAPTGYCLPALKFFKPKKKFFTLMKKRYEKSLIYDVGAGMGHITERLVERGFNAHAIDLHYRDDGFDVEIANGVLYNYEPDSMIMFCRPSHGGFVEAVIDRAKECNVREIIYIGLNKNVRNDLWSYEKDATKIKGPFGSDKENVWIIDLTD